MDGIQTTLYPRYLPKTMPYDKPICIVGQIIDVSESNSVTLDCDPDNKEQITIQVPGNIDIGSIKSAKFIEVRGLRNENGTIHMREFTDLKDNFDLKTYNEIVGLAFREFRDIFNYTQ